MFSFWNELSNTQKLDFLRQIISTISIVIGAIISIIIFSLTKRKEINFKIHEQRKLKYEHYLSLFEKVFADPTTVEEGKLPIEKEEWIKMQIGIILYGSDKVAKKIVEMNEIGRNNNSENPNIIIKLD